MSKVVAVDFDGTCVTDAFPGIGPLKPGCLRVLSRLAEAGATVVLWTCRTGGYLEEAVAFLGASGVKLNAVNQNTYPPDWDGPRDDSRKIHADVYIDDKALGGFPGWAWAERELEKLGILSAS